MVIPIDLTIFSAFIYSREPLHVHLRENRNLDNNFPVRSRFITFIQCTNESQQH